MIKKKPVRGSAKVSVTFSTPAALQASSVHLVGDFNQWDRNAHAMKRRKDGSWAITLRLPEGGSYQFLYLVDGERWLADDAADARVGNPYGGDNAVVQV
jgi:1,4-alpha-glucan branching enzyme